MLRENFLRCALCARHRFVDPSNWRNGNEKRSPLPPFFKSETSCSFPMFFRAKCDRQIHADPTYVHTRMCVPFFLSSPLSNSFFSCHALGIRRRQFRRPSLLLLDSPHFIFCSLFRRRSAAFPPFFCLLAYAFQMRTFPSPLSPHILLSRMEKRKKNLFFLFLSPSPSLCHSRILTP